MPNTGCGPWGADRSLLAAVLPLPTDADDWITTQIRHLYGNPQGNIGGPLPGLPDVESHLVQTSLVLSVHEIDRRPIVENGNAVRLADL
jgi:hypothetical protein